MGEAPEVAQVAHRYEDEIQFIGMAGRSGEEAMQAFVDQHSLDFPHAVDTDGSLWARFGVTAQPAWAFIDDSGTVDVRFGSIPTDELESILQELASS
jgi:peroxiredoxin